MWLYFNSKGQLITSLEHGNPARVGSTAFEIFATVEGLNENNIANYMATIKLRKPDLTGSSYPTLLMENASATFYKREDEGDTGEFENNQTYYGFLFDFGSFNDNEEEEILLDTDGLWEAIINVIKDNYDVQGVATFNVAGHGTEQASSISYDIITNQLVQNINRRALKEQTLIVIENSSVDISGYDNGQKFFVTNQNAIYVKENSELKFCQSFLNIENYEPNITFEEIGFGTHIFNYKTPTGNGVARYTITGLTSIESDNAPIGSSATFSQTGNNTVGQITSGNSMSLMIEGLSGYKITSLRLKMRSNSNKGAGSLSFVADPEGEPHLLAEIENSAFSQTNWNGSYSISWVMIDVPIADNDYEIGENGSVLLEINGSVNSLYVSEIYVGYNYVGEEQIGFDNNLIDKGSIYIIGITEPANHNPNYVEVEIESTINQLRWHGVVNKATQLNEFLILNGEYQDNYLTEWYAGNVVRENTDSGLNDVSLNPVQNRVVTQQLQNIREVIAGKNKTYILSCNWNIAYLKENADEVRNSEGTDISHDIVLGDYDDYITYNEGFNTQEQVVNNIRDTDYIILRDDTNCYYLLENQWMLESFLKLGDVIYILETNVPDRWFAGDYNLYALESVSKLYKHVITGFTYQSYSFGLVVVNNSSQRFTNDSVSLTLFGEGVLSVYFFLTTNASRKYKVLDLYPIGSPNMQVGNQIKVVHLSTQDLTTIVSTNWTIGTIEDTVSIY